MSIIWILIIAAALYLIASTVIGIFMTQIFVYSKNKSMEFTMNACLENEDYTMEEFDSYAFRDFTITSDYGYDLHGVFSPGTDETKTVVFVHGHTWSWHGQVKYFHLYRKRGYNIVAYNHRHHGDSGGPNCTAGYYEKYDLKKITEWAREQFPKTELLGIMGESLGAATSCQAVPLIEGLSFAHVDCPYDNMMDLYDHQLAYRHIPRVFSRLATCLSVRYTRMKAGFDPYAVSPKDAIMESDIPMLFIHGDADTYVPTKMSVNMVERRKESADTTLVLIEGARHAQAIKTDPELYEKSVDAFLDRVEAV